MTRFLLNTSGAYADRPRARMPSANWQRARNYAAGAIGPAIGLSPMAYGIPFPGYPSLADQQKVGVSLEESQAWRQVYAAQQRDRGIMANPDPAYGMPMYSYPPSSLFDPQRVGVSQAEAAQWMQVYPGQRAERILAEQGKVGMSAAEAEQWKQVYPQQERERWLAAMRKPGVPASEMETWKGVHAAQLPERGFVANPLPDWCPSSITTTIKGKKWCFDPKTNGWICAEASGNCDPAGSSAPMGLTAAKPGRLQRRVRARNSARMRNCGQESPWPPSAGYGTGQYGGQYGPNRSLNPRSRIRTRVTPRSEADTCFSVCCGLHEPGGSDCGSGGKITQPKTWECMTRCLKLPEPKAGRARRPSKWVSLPGRPRGWCGPGEHLCAAKSPGPGSNYCCCDSKGECVGGKIVLANTGAPRRVQNGCFRPGHANHPGRAIVACRMKNTGVNGEALSVPPFCDAGDCTSKGCGPCDWNAYEVPGRVETVLQAMAQAREDVDFATHAANEGLRDMYAVPYRTQWADPSAAILTKPGGPAPQNPMDTAQWQRCMRGPAVPAHPSSNRQIIPGGTP
ncbi:MAG: hypothetical protein Q8Q14_10720 [Gemmatimonadales bacterium]|nr:hypothetical protein [Gemmatimonadales bacterium]